MKAEKLPGFAQKNSQVLQVGLGFIWIMLFVLVCIAIYFQDKFFALQGQTIAKLANKSGNVTMRSEELANWSEVDKSHGFFDGDRVATGAKSTAIVDFGEGRRLEMGENTQIAISAIRQDKGLNFVVNLVKGSVDVQDKGQSKYAMALTSGRQSFQVEKGKRVAIAKPIGEAAKEFIPTKNSLLDAPENAQPQSDFTLPIATPTPLPTPTPVPALEIPTTAKMTLKNPNAYLNKASFAATVEALPNFTFDVATEIPNIPEVNWTGLLALKRPGSEKGAVITLPLQAGQKNATFQINAKSIEPVFAKEKVGEIPVLMLNATLGVRATRNNEKNETMFKKSSAQIEIALLGSLDNGNGPLSIKLASWSKDAAPTSDLFPLKISRSGQLGGELVIADSRMFGNLHAYVARAQVAGISREANLPEKGIFFIKGGNVIAGVSGKGLNESYVNELRSAIDADIAFRGSKKSFYVINGKSRDEVNNFLAENLGRGGNIFIRNAKELVPISKSLISGNSLAARFVTSNASHIFLERVEILSQR